MPKPILYAPPSKNLVWGAFACTVVIFGGAVAAAIKREAPPVNLADIPVASVEATLDQPDDQPTPPPEDIPIPEPPPMPQEIPEFHEESTPPPKVKPTRPSAPIKAPQSAMKTPGQMSISGAKAVAISAPRPEYPYEARSRHITGTGVCVMSVDTASGSVTDASMAKSIGNSILDNSAVSAFKRWRFQPGKCAPKVQVSITFTMTGASY
jgi:protein TonB